MLHIIFFIITFFLGFLLTIILNPIFSFALYEAVYFLYPENRWWGGGVPNISYSFYSVLLMLSVLLFNYKDTMRNRLLAPPQMKWLFMVGITFLLASFTAVFPEFHNQSVRDFITLIAVIVIAYKIIDSDKKLNIAIWGYLYGAFYLGFYIFQQGRNAGDRVEYIGTADATDSNGIAAALVPSVVLCLYYFWVSNKTYRRFIFILAGIFTANALVLINSRGAFLGVACSLAYFMYFMYFSPIQKKNQKTTVIFLMLIGMSGVVYLVDDSFIERMQTMTVKKDVTEQSGSTRMIFWSAAWEMAKDHPMGLGARGFQFYAPLYIPEEVGTGGSRHRAVHSSWFEALSEAGYLGLISFCMMLFSSFNATRACKILAKKQQDIDRYFKIIAIEAALIGFIITMTFLNRYRAEVLYWLVLYTICAYNIYIIIPKQKNREAVKSI